MKSARNWLLVGALVALGCTEDPAATAPTGPWPRYALDDSASLYTHPYPSDVRFAPGTPPHVDDLPNPLDTVTVDGLKRMIRETRTGAGLTAGLTLTLAADVDLGAWPRTTTASAQPTSPVQWIELDVEGTPNGRRIPFRWQWFADGGVYHPERVLRLVPESGFALEPNARYALLIRRGAGIEAGPAMQRLLSGETPPGSLGPRAREVVGATLADLGALGIATDDLVFLHTITTDDPAALMRGLVEDVVAANPSPRFAGLERTRDETAFCLLEGRLTVPQYQQGTAPFFDGQGDFAFAADGRLIPQGREAIPIAIVVPKGAMPAAGWPLVVYIHGTAGVSTQLIDRGPTPPEPGHEGALTGGHLTTKNRGTGWVLAQRGIASAGAALPVNPQRVPDVLGWGIYNFLYPEALRDNFRQGVLEQALFLRALLATRLAPSLCPGSDASAADDGRIGFADERVGGMGQSLGAIELGIWTPAEDRLGAVVPSGAGGTYMIMITTSTIIPGELAIRALAWLNDNETPTLLHPIGGIVQMAIEPVDPVALAARTVRRPLAAVGPKHVFAPAGYLDGFFMPESINALLGPLGVAQAGDPVHPALGDVLERRGTAPVTYPAGANLASGHTAIAVQFHEDGVLDGHHVSYQLPGPKHQIACFFRSYFDGGTPMVPAPGAITDPCP